MGYKRCLEENEFEDLSLNKAKRFECNNELVSLADTNTPDKAFAKTVMSGVDEGGFYNIQWLDALEEDNATEATHAGDKNVQTSHFSSCSSEDDAGSGATSLSCASSDRSEFDVPQKEFVPLDDAYSALDCSPRRPVPIGPNHQASIPVWRGRVNKKSELGTYNHDSPSFGLLSVHTIDDNEEKLMGTSVLSMPESSFYSSKDYKVGDGRKECNCFDQGSIRCVRQHVREARETLRKIIGKENFVKLGLCEMGEDVALNWSEEEEEVFHEVVYSNPASLGRNFWKHLSAAYPARTTKEIVSYYFNVFMLQRRAAQNRSRFLDIDSDDDECHTRNAGFYGFENSEDDSAIESLGDQDVRVENQDNYSDEDDGDDGSSDDGTVGNYLGLTGYDMGNTTDVEGGIDQRSSKDKVISLIDSWSDPIHHIDGTPGILVDDIGVQDDSCMSFECDTNMDVSRSSHGLVDASSAFQARGYKCDQSTSMPGKLDLSSDEMEHVFLLEPCDAKDWYPGYSTCRATDIEFLPTSNLIEEFFGHGTPDKKTSK